MDKSALVIEIVASVLRSDKDQQWHDIGDRLAREKVGHALREAKLRNNKSRRKRDRPATKSCVAPEQALYSENPSIQQQQKQQQESLRDETLYLGQKWEPLPLVDSSTTGILSDLDGFMEVMLGLAVDGGVDSDPTMAKLEENQAWSADLEPSLCYQTLFREFQ